MSGRARLRMRPHSCAVLTCCDRAAGRVDEQLDVARGVLGVQKQQLTDDDVSTEVINLQAF